MKIRLFEELSVCGLAPIYNSNGSLIGHFIVMEYFGIFHYAYYRMDNGQFMFEKENIMKMSTIEGPNGIKYIFDYQTSGGDINYVGEVMKNVVVSI